MTDLRIESGQAMRLKAAGSAKPAWDVISIGLWSVTPLWSDGRPRGIVLT